MKTIKVDEATQADAQTVLIMAESAYVAAGHVEHLGPFDPDRIAEIIEAMIDLEDSEVLLATVDSKPVGMIALAVNPVLLAPGFHMTQEITWWVNEDQRTNGVGDALLAAAAKWAVEHDTKELWISSPKTVQEIATMCVRRGFRLLESIYVKGV